MNPLLAAAIAVLMIFAAGFGTSMLFLRDSQGIAIGKLTALSWLFGTLVVSFGLWLLGMTMRDAWLYIAVTILCLTLAIAGVVLFVRSGKPRLHVPWPPTWFESLLALLICLEIAILFRLTFENSLGWDGLLIWEIKARYAFLNGGAVPAAYFSDLSRVYSHTEYPLYLPMLEMWVYFWIGDCNQYWVKLIFPIFHIVGLLFLAQAASTWSGKRWVGLFAANLFFFVPFLTRVEGGVIQGYADVPLSVVYLGAFYFLSIFARDNSRTPLAIYVALAALLPWIKREGVVLWFVLSVCGVSIIWRRRGIRSAVVSLLPGLIVIGGWQLYLRQMHLQAPGDFFPITLSILCSNFHRLIPIADSLLKEAATMEHWSLLWYLAPVAFLSLFWRNGSQISIVLFICTTLPIALYCSTYLLSSWPDYLHHVSFSLPRLLLHVTPLSILSIVLALAPPAVSAPHRPSN
jgi:hypothetical protein